MINVKKIMCLDDIKQIGIGTIVKVRNVYGKFADVNNSDFTILTSRDLEFNIIYCMKFKFEESFLTRTFIGTIFPTSLDYNHYNKIWEDSK